MDDSSHSGTVDRRALLVATAGIAGTALAGCSASGDGGPAREFDGWFDGVSNYDGVVDETGADEVEVAVGAKGNGGHFAFAPPAVRVAPETTFVWKWTGRGSVHNVVADDGSFRSDATSSADETFERTFESSGTHGYYCGPHRSSGMRGVVVVE